jgi:hypothetical protein
LSFFGAGSVASAVLELDVSGSVLVATLRFIEMGCI